MPANIACFPKKQPRITDMPAAFELETTSAIVYTKFVFISIIIAFAPREPSRVGDSSPLTIAD
ncbi:hypothetical protein JCM14469_17670 [Desulfatiferula olefinivorans]